MHLQALKYLAEVYDLTLRYCKSRGIDPRDALAEIMDVAKGLKS
jgi:hypothetical protein